MGNLFKGFSGFGWPSGKGNAEAPVPTPADKGPEVSVVTRHSKKPDKSATEGPTAASARYPGISEAGVELARERAKEILGMVEKAPKGAVLFIGGASELVRTASTAEVYGDELEKLVEGRTDVEVISRKRISEYAKAEGAPGYTNIVKEITERVDRFPGRTFVVDFPLFLKGMSASAFVEITREDGKVKEGATPPYFAKLMSKHGGDQYLQLREWIETGGVMEEDGERLVGPRPEEIVAGHAKALERLRAFAEKQVPGRPVIIGVVGHSWWMDALLVFAAKGTLDAASLDEVDGGKDIISETEAGTITIQDGRVRVQYRGKTFERELPYESES